MYEEIKRLREYCDKIGIYTLLLNHGDGYILRFVKGDAVQHRYSYGCDDGCVEFGYTGSRIDYKATTLKNAKAFVKRNKDYLNMEVKQNEVRK